VKPPIVVTMGAAMAAGGAFVARRYSRTTRAACTLAHSSPQANPNSGFLSHCVGPGALYLGGLVLLAGGGILLVVGVLLFVRSVTSRTRRARRRRRPPDPRRGRRPRRLAGTPPQPAAHRFEDPVPLAPLPPLRAAPPAEPASAELPRVGATMLLPQPVPDERLPRGSPSPGWYRTAADGPWRWWDGTAWVADPPMAPPGWYPAGSDGTVQWWDGTAWAPTIRGSAP
jgi:hypothetical protein